MMVAGAFPWFHGLTVEERLFERSWQRQTRAQTWCRQAWTDACSQMLPGVVSPFLKEKLLSPVLRAGTFALGVTTRAPLRFI